MLSLWRGRDAHEKSERNVQAIKTVIRLVYSADKSFFLKSSLIIVLFSENQKKSEILQIFSKKSHFFAYLFNYIYGDFMEAAPPARCFRRRYGKD